MNPFKAVNKVFIAVLLFLVSSLGNLCMHASMPFGGPAGKKEFKTHTHTHTHTQFQEKDKIMVFSEILHDATALHRLHDHRLMELQFSQMGRIGKIAHQIKGVIRMVTDLGGFLPILLTLSAFFLGWRAVGIMANCDNPLVVVLSGSMEPAYHRGDLLLLHKISKVNIGDVIVFSLPGRTVPIVHRVHGVHEDGGTLLFLTKGDNNELDDRTLYPEGYHWVRDEDATGKVFAIIPNAGFLTILSEDRPWIKFLALSVAILWGCISGG